MNSPLAFNVTEAANSVRMSRAFLYEEIKQGRLEAIKFGRSTRITLEALRNWLDSRARVEPRAR